jgi:Rieske Fe-S protein
MADKTNDMEHCNNNEALRSRRAVLKMIASAPLVVSFGLLASPLMRYLKPTMGPGNFFQAADLPAADPPPKFYLSDFPDIWSALPFMIPMKYLIFNPEQYEIRKLPGIAIRIEQNEITAFSRICPMQGDHVLYYDRPTNGGSCGCTDKSCKGACIGHSNTPVLVCPRDHSVFDVSSGGRVLAGPATRPLRRFTVNRDGDFFSITHLEQCGIA